MFFAFLNLSWMEISTESLSPSPHPHCLQQNRNVFNLPKCNPVVEQEILRWSERILRCLLWKVFEIIIINLEMIIA